MANEAHKEPTMEEILASIRKIISDDDVPAVEPSSANVEDFSASDVLADEPKDFEDSFESLTADDVLDEVTEDMADSIFEDEEGFEPEVSAETDTVIVDDLPEPVSFDEMAGIDTKAGVVDEPLPVVEEPANEVAEPEPVEATPEPEIHATEEADMAASAKYEKTVLTNDNTAETAAGALGKLISKMDIGGDNTIEGLVREMLKPMIKDWLDANLPAIVEEKVEAEVQRIARMAR